MNNIVLFSHSGTSGVVLPRWFEINDTVIVKRRRDDHRLSLVDSGTKLLCQKELSDASVEKKDHLTRVVEILDLLGHPNIGVHHLPYWGEGQNTLYIPMEYHGGGSLQQLINATKRCGGFPRT